MIRNGMYGVDVISCLNKANSNNKKYAEGGAFLIGNEYGKTYYVDVYVKLNDYLEESLEYYFFKNGVQVQGFEETISKTMKDVNFDIKKDYYTTFKDTDSIGNISKKITEENAPFGIEPLKENGGNCKLDKDKSYDNKEISGYYSLRDTDSRKRNFSS